jgi:hypothetical protein
MRFRVRVTSVNSGEVEQADGDVPRGGHDRRGQEAITAK